MLENNNKQQGSVIEVKYLIYSAIIIAITIIIEVIGGIVSHSLVLLSDAVHMFTDLFVLALSWIANVLSFKKSDIKRSYGYHRSKIIAAFVNSLILFFIVLLIIIESVQRFISPIDVEWRIMLVVAIFSLISNIMIFIMLHYKCERNLSIKSVILHVTGDIVSSLAIIFASITIMFVGWQIIDPILSIFVSIIIISSGYRILKNSCHILLEGTPKGISAEEIKDQIVSEIPDVIDIHHIHTWSLCENYLITTMHAKVKSGAQHTDILLYRIKKVLLDKFKIVHSTVEIEYYECADNKILRH